MDKSRMEAFSDGVIAILITIMVLEMKVPNGISIASLKPVLPVFLSYILSFFNIAIYWNNHHHMMHSVQHVNGRVLWANTHLLFWLSLVPFVTGWMGENHFAKVPVAVYGFILFMAGIAYYILAHCLADLHGKESAISLALGKDVKGIISVIIYIIGIFSALIHPWIGFTMYALVIAMWLIPDRRFEQKHAKLTK